MVLKELRAQRVIMLQRELKDPPAIKVQLDQLVMLALKVPKVLKETKVIKDQPVMLL
jgi:hypothetical protein